METTNVLAIPTGGQHEAVTYDKSVEITIANAEKQVDVLKRILGIAIKRTNPHDWTNISDKPYLGSSGCEKVAPLFGVKMFDVVNVRDERDDDKGKHYLYTFQATFTWQGGSIEAIGACSSRDKFFGWDSQTKTYKEMHDVDETNIKKAAYSNLIVNGITRLLGIRNLEWSDLSPFGIDKESVSKVEYNKGASVDQASKGLISEAQGKRLYAIARAAGWDEEGFKEWLLKEYKLESTKNIPWKQYDAIVVACQRAKGKEPGV